MRFRYKTVSVATLEIAPLVAVMVLVPALTPVAMPLALTVTTAGLLEVQVTEPDIFPSVASEKVPVAVSTVVLPLAKDMVSGEIESPVKLAPVTVMPAASEVTPYTPPPLMEAVMLVVPIALPVTTPALDTLAVADAADIQLTVLVISAVDPFV
ncbi:MAG: hypothetical protein Q7U91_05285 [Sideroxyarcus sp.]|nr:hypothetical protein [Sideroxyarcus sp.]